MRRFGLFQLALGWLLLAGLLYLFFSGWLERQFNPNPAAALVTSGGEVRLLRNRAGHYVAEGHINGETVVFMLDTGATQVAIPEGMARRLNLGRGAAVQVATANGMTVGYRTRLDRVGLGPIELADVPAIITPGMTGEVALLGMSFLKRLEFTQRGDELILRLPSSH